MNRLTQAFADKSKKLLCPFLTAGYPSMDVTPDLILAAQNAGAGVVELGIPFSDPVADGPVIQASYTHAISHGATVDKTLNAAKQARAKGATLPIVAMVSFSIIFKRGTEAFAAACRDHGIDGLILPDIPLEEAPAIAEAVRSAGLKTCFLIAPTSPAERRAAIAKLCDGFIYYLSVSGITGERKALPHDIGPNLQALRKVTDAPICVGFGISTAEQVREVTTGGGADGAIVGSALVRRLTNTLNAGPQAQIQAVSDFVSDLAKGLA
jgi:tryptophan synthase alpha chain